MKNNYKTIIRSILFAGIIIFSSGSIAFSQMKYEISGQVKDEQSKQALEFCTVRVFDLKDSLISGAATNDKGFFYAQLSVGDYKFLVDYLGFKTDTVAVNVKNENVFLGTFKLSQDDNSLDEITINGTTKENLLDKEVVLVTEDMRTGAGDTKDVLSKVKGVDYDRYNNTIKVDNNDNIIILVNGLEKDQEYIKNLAPDRLQKIEIIRDPSGRYALEGYSAVINVILKQDYKGIEFYLTERPMIDLDTKNIDFILPINNFSATFNYTYNKVNIYSKISHNLVNLNLLTSSQKEYNSGLDIYNGSVNDNPNLIFRNFTDNYTIGADYYINPKHTVSFESNAKGLLFTENLAEDRSRLIYSQNGNVLNDDEIYSINDSKNKSYYHSVFYIGNLNQKNSLHVDFTYSNYYDTYANDYFVNTLKDREETGTNDKQFTTFNSELNHTINQKSTFQIGYGNTILNMSNTFNSLNLQVVPEIAAGTTDFSYSDVRHKLYAYYSYNLNEKFGIKLGAAAETSAPKADDLKTNYFIYQPYADIKYTPIKVIDIRFKYRSSSDYPSIEQANPFTSLIDQESIRTGNPFLKPAVTHKTSVNMNIMQGLASVEPYYHFSENYIAQIGTLREDGIFEYSFDNVGKYINMGIKVGLTIPFGKSLFFQNNADFFKSSIEYNGKMNDLKDWTMNSQLIYVNKKSSTVAGIIYQNNLRKVITAQGYNNRNNDLWGVLVQQPFFKQKLNVMVLYILPIKLGAEYAQGSYIETDTYSETKIEDLNVIKNILMLQISYRFNKGKSIKSLEKDIKIEEEKKSKGLF